MVFYDSLRVFRRTLLASLFLVTGTAVPAFAANSGGEEKGHTPASKAPVALSIEGISVQADDDYPRVLNILPWQAPTVTRRNQDPLPLDEAGLLEPANPYAMRRHNQFRKTLDPLSDPLKTTE